MPFVVGENVGPYRIVEQLGQGGMASVYKAYHAALDRYVAIKALHPAFLEDPNFLARFQREARMVAKLEHDNIVPIYDYSEHEGRPYLVMKFIEGETLKARIARDSLDLDEVLRIVKAMGAGLAYAHKRGILHRDVKPSNVLMADDGRIYITDFGLARMAQAGESTISSDMLLGTPQYISPEQALGKKDLDERTDIYSMGVLLYELLVGRVPFRADTPYSIIHDHIYTPLPLPSAINPKVSKPVERVLLKALAKEREDRFASVNDLVTVFTQAVTVPEIVGELVKPKKPSPEETAPAGVGVALERIEESIAPVREAEARTTFERFRERWRWWYLAPILVVCCLCSFLALGIINRQRQEDQTSKTTPELLASPSSVGALSPRQVTSVSPLEGELTLEEAGRRVEENPDDPYAHLDLALALWKDGQSQEALRFLNKAIELAGEDFRFFLQAGDSVAEHQLWLMASDMYLHMARYAPGELSIELETKLFQSLYLAAEDSRVIELFSRNNVEAVDPFMFSVVKTRYELYNGDIDVAGMELDEILKQNPDSPEARLLYAEYLLKRGKIEEAKAILTELYSGEAPDWIQREARILTGTIIK
ncbi:MAG: protein kinase [Chloroflexota bacterium]